MRVPKNVLKSKYFKEAIMMGRFMVPPHRPVPDHIVKPDYYATKGSGKFSSAFETKVVIHDKDTIEKMKIAAKIAAGALQAALDFVTPGVTTHDIDGVVHDYIISKGAYPAPIWYQGFPKSVCTSVNEVVCHGIPDSRPLQDGDILNIDVTTYINGVFGDTSDMALVGSSHSAKILELIKVTHDCVHEAIKICKPGVPVSAIGNLIESLAENQGFGVCQEFSGHGIGKSMHMPPAILACKNEIATQMQPGMTFTIEPIIMMNKNYNLAMWDDNWTVVDTTLGPSAQYEHTILITDEACEVITQR